MRLRKPVGAFWRSFPYLCLFGPLVVEVVLLGVVLASRSCLDLSCVEAPGAHDGWLLRLLVRVLWTFFGTPLGALTTLLLFLELLFVYSWRAWAEALRMVWDQLVMGRR